MLKKEFVLTNQGGLHARPATTFVQLCKTFQSNIRVESAGKQADAKSIISIMSLGAGQGNRITVLINGGDETLAMDKIGTYLANLTQDRKKLPEELRGEVL